MSANLFGSRFQIMSFGESHGTALGVVIDGCPAGLLWNEAVIKKELERRRPGVRAESSQQVVSARSEADEFELLSGVFDSRTLGTPIAMIVRNKDQKSQDYDSVKLSPRTGHADDVWKTKFGHADHRGGGRSSGRETLSRVLGGAVAKMVLAQWLPNLRVIGYTSQVGEIKLSEIEIKEAASKNIDAFEARFPSVRHNEIRDLLLKTQADGNSLGGCAEILIKGLPAGLGQPVFHKLKSDLAMALMSVGAVNGVEFGAGFAASIAEGIEFHRGKDAVYGGIRGGISTGEDVLLRVSFKPTSSLLDVAKKGRHDPFIVTRAIPVLEAMVNLVLLDHIIWSKADRI